MTRPPVAQLIYEHRMRLGLSFRQAAAKAGISEGSWRRTESDRKLTRTPETIARMARVTGVSGEQLANAGWPQAAGILATLTEAHPDGDRSAAEELADLRAAYRGLEETVRRMESKLDDALRSHREPEPEEDGHANGSRRAGLSPHLVA
jgi:transcriptional regulator with XRE-family HTH domain